jgi:hypothetical protein
VLLLKPIDEINGSILIDFGSASLYFFSNLHYIHLPVKMFTLSGTELEQKLRTGTDWRCVPTLNNFELFLSIGCACRDVFSWIVLKFKRIQICLCPINVTATHCIYPMPSGISPALYNCRRQGHDHIGYGYHF